jgi:hypothetical protein
MHHHPNTFIAHNPSTPSNIPVPILSTPLIAAPLGLAEVLVVGVTLVEVETVPLGDTEDDAPVWVEQFVKGQVADAWFRTA